ncbi:unnamed protein product [Dovyalis caffra]|uniref:Uncharacterized protein n=1 Tax=Dovyalis caffra TaxID=77055 RepID=A0AAV1SFV2_9ROSI|nr:unnamed protein product [Dovyalis caffra]
MAGTEKEQIREAAREFLDFMDILLSPASKVLNKCCNFKRQREVEVPSMRIKRQCSVANHFSLEALSMPTQLKLIHDTLIIISFLYVNMAFYVLVSICYALDQLESFMLLLKCHNDVNGKIIELHQVSQLTIKDYGTVNGGKSFFMPLRVLLSGKLHGPDMGSCIILLHQAGTRTLFHLKLRL